MGPTLTIILEINKRSIPLLLLNGRITKKTYKRWKNIEFFSKYIFENFNLCLAQNDETKLYLKKLGVSKVIKTGNLKFSETSSKNINNINKIIQDFLNSKKILFGAISTHQSEEIFCSKIHAKISKLHKNAAFCSKIHVKISILHKNACENQHFA